MGSQSIFDEPPENLTQIRFWRILWREFDLEVFLCQNKIRLLNLQLALVGAFSNTKMVG